ncbi:ABC transporter permease [Isoptericola halotolerans]|uniref:Peptide/nickel transport system permease protein n=1 Tax=Isoptericola halotolerans TaxID=300560 RepID=A0ABX2AA31_9MICO|nr:ABC transporter permease [Isoptericola halotolerans]NOV98683.1 peptide/nickel transport system permease protein [Isoptericola halotolerans]
MTPDLLTGRVGWVLGRLLLAAATLLLLSAVIFTVTDVLPGDAAARLAGPDADPAEVARLRADLGLDRPAPERYLEWLGGALRGDLGVSAISGRPVADVVGERLPNSVVLAGVALLVAAPLGVAAGLLAGMRPGRRADRAVTGLSVVVVAIPEFVMTVLLIVVLATTLGWFPQVSTAPLGGRPWDAPAAMVLPVLSLVPLGFGLSARMMRSTTAGVAATRYVEAARLRGVTGGALAVRHVLPNAVQPVIQVVAVLFGGLIGGSIVVELVFNYPGIGLELQQAVGRQDLVMVQGITLVLAALALASLLLGDLVAGLVDPRERR